MQRGGSTGVMGITGSAPRLGEGVVESQEKVLSSESFEVPRNSRFYLLMSTAWRRGTQRQTGKTCLPPFLGCVCVCVRVCVIGPDQRRAIGLHLQPH